jgi:hypothetical protein
VRLMIRERSELEKNLAESIISHKIKTKKKVVKDIKNYLNEVYQVLPGTVQLIINDPITELPKLDPRLLCLINEQIYAKTGDINIAPESYYNESEIKKSKQYSGRLELEDEIEFPLTIKNVIMFDTDTFFFPISLELLANLSRSRKINYNFDIQREAVKKEQHGDIIYEAKLVMKNVNEIKENLINNTQERTSIVVNAAIRTSDEGNELIYNPTTKELTITSGTRLDIVDGYHRTRASELAVTEKPEIKDFTFGCWILNYSDDRAAKYQGQLNMGTPIAKERQEFLSSSSHTDLVIKDLKVSSELKNRISDTNVIKPTVKEIVSYRVLKDAISEQFKLPKMRDVHDVSDYLKLYFDYLFGYFSDEFISNVNEVNKYSIINSNNLFYGYIVLARKMFEAGIQPKEVKKYIAEIDFSRDNPLWLELGVLDKEGTFSDTKKSRLAIKKYFEEIDLEKVSNNV